MVVYVNVIIHSLVLTSIEIALYELKLPFMNYPLAFSMVAIAGSMPRSAGFSMAIVSKMET